MKTKNYFLLLLIMIIIESQTMAYPISPRPLRKLIMESEYIITGFVTDLKEEKSKKKDDWFGGHYAVVRVNQVLQGKVNDSILMISYSPNMICPAPPHFIKDTYVLVFLDKYKGAYTVHALSYGVKTLLAEQVEVYRSRIAKMQSILQVADKDEQFQQTIEWLVTCAENPVTRYEGVYELSPTSDFMSYYDRAQNQPFQYLLTPDQKRRLKDALLINNESDYVNFGLVDLVYVGNEEEIFTYLRNGLSRIKENQLWFADGFMRRMVLYKPSDRLTKLIEKYEEKRFDEKDSKVLMALIKDFLEEIKTL